MRAEEGFEVKLMNEFRGGVWVGGYGYDLAH